MIPKNTVKLEENDARKTMKIIDALEDSDDVQEVYANFDIPEDVLEAWPASVTTAAGPAEAQRRGEA